MTRVAWQPLEDWHDLLRAVIDRLRQTAGEATGSAAVPTGDDLGIRGDVASCATALGQLHTTLQHELDLQQIELEALRSALARAMAQAAATPGEAARARQQLRHDGLTQMTHLPTQAGFVAQLDLALAQAATADQTVALCVLGLDGFEAMVAGHGRSVGDALLSLVATRLTRCIRTDDLWCHLDGAEFACLLTALPDRQPLQRLADQWWAALSAPLQIGQLRVDLRPRIGISLRSAQGASGEQLLAQANRAMALARQRDSRHEFFDSPAGAGPDPGPPVAG